MASRRAETIADCPLALHVALWIVWVLQFLFWAHFGRSLSFVLPRTHSPKCVRAARVLLATRQALCARVNHQLSPHTHTDKQRSPKSSWPACLLSRQARARQTSQRAAQQLQSPSSESALATKRPRAASPKIRD